MRVLLRLTSRNLRRLVRTNLLVVVLIALSVAAGVYSAVLVRSDQVTAEDDYLASVGTSDFQLQYGGFESSVNEMGVAIEGGPNSDVLAAEWSELVPALEEAGGSVLAWQSNQFGSAFLAGADHNYNLSDADLDQMLEHEVVLDIEGRAPEKFGEIAISRIAAAEVNLTVGDTTTSLSGAEVTVVGLVRHRPIWGEKVVYLPEGSLPEPDWQQPLEFGVNGLTREQIAETARNVGLTEFKVENEYPTEDTRGAGDRPQYTVTSLDDAGKNHTWYGHGGSSDEPQIFGALTASALLFQTALISAVAFVVSIRRRTRDIGRLTAIGAGPSQLYRMFMLEAAALGVAGAIVGCALGLAVAYGQYNVLVPRILGDASLRVLELEVQPSDLVVPAVLAVVAAVLAMAIPAMWATSLSPEKARNDGYGSVSVSSRLASASAGVFVFGCFTLLFISRVLTGPDQYATDWFMKEVLLVLSGLPILVGTAGLVFVAMQVLHKRASSLPLRLRFSSRDALRNPIRSVGAVTAFMALLMIVTIGMTADASQQTHQVYEHESQRTLSAAGPEDSVVAFMGGGPIDVAQPTDTTLRQPSEIDPDLEIEGQRLRSDVIINFHTSDERRSSISFGLAGLPELIATPEVTSKFNLRPDVREILDEGSQLVLLVAEPERLPPASANIVEGNPFEQGTASRLEIVESEVFGGSPILLVPPALVEREGFVTAKTSVLYKEDGFTPEQISNLSRYGYISTSSDADFGWSPFRAQLFVMIPVGLFILVVSRILSALSGVDSGTDIATMVSVGAPANFRRSQLAWQMAYCAALAVVAAFPAGLIAGWVFTLGSRNFRFGFDVPLGVLLGSLLIPALAWVLIFVTTRRGQANVSHRLV